MSSFQSGRVLFMFKHFAYYSCKQDDRHSILLMASLLSFKASDLLKEEEVLSKLRKSNYRVQYQKCLNVVDTAHTDLHKQYTLYKIPLVLPGDPHFDLTECVAYLKKKLTDAEFYVKLMQPGNILLISWLPDHVEKVKKKAAKEIRKGQQKDEAIKDAKTAKDAKDFQNSSSKNRQTEGTAAKSEDRIAYQPASALSNLSFRSSLMRDNPKYDHLKSMQRLKRKGKGKSSRARR